MKILVHSFLFPNSRNPVLGTFVYFYVKALQNLGHSVTVVSPIPYVPWGLPRSHQWYDYNATPFRISEKNLTVYHPRFFSIPWGRMLYLRGHLTYLTARPFYNRLLSENTFDIIHSHVALPDGVIGRIMSRKAHIPYGITIHGGDIYHSIHQSRISFRLIKKTIENAKFVGVVSHRLKSLIKENNIFPSTPFYRVIYNGINKPKHPLKAPDGFKNQGEVRLLSASHAVERKGIKYVLLSLAELRKKHHNLAYYVIGDGIDLPYFKEVARREGVEDITHFLGRRSNEEIMQYMNAADIFVLPSWNEAFGVVFIEAMLMKTPIIACKNEGISEIIENGRNGFLVEAKSTRELVKVLDNLISNETLREEVAKNGYNSVKDQFDWNKNARAYLDIFEKIVANKP